MSANMVKAVDEKTFMRFLSQEYAKHAGHIKEFECFFEAIVDQDDQKIALVPRVKIVEKDGNDYLQDLYNSPNFVLETTAKEIPIKDSDKENKQVH